MRMFDFLRKKETLGERGEREAAHYYKKLGFKVIERNYRYRKCEIDFIATDRKTIAFVEVKSRSCVSPENMMYGTRPVFAVNKDKQMHIIYAAKGYMRANPKLKKQPRLDIVEVFFDKEPEVGKKKVLKINHIPNAFGE